MLPVLEPVKHIRQLYIDAIDAAEELIYMENQYFSSQAIYEALKKRLIDQRPALPADRADIAQTASHAYRGYLAQRDSGKNASVPDRNRFAYRRQFGVYFTAAALKNGGLKKRPISIPKFSSWMTAS